MRQPGDEGGRAAQAGEAWPSKPLEADRKHRLRWWTLAVLAASLLVIIVDDTIVNVALPTLQRELGASAAETQWIVDAYVLVFAGLLLTSGVLGDRFGRRRFLQLGLALFGLSSVAGAFAGSTTALIVARASMGVGAAMVMPSTLSIIIDVFPREERIKAIGMWAGIAHLGIPLGPLLGGWLLGHFFWGALFLVNVPLVSAAVVASLFVVPESRHPAPPAPDWPGMLLSVTALIALLYSIIEAPSLGLLHPNVLGAFLLALLTGGLYVAHQRRSRSPMLDLRVFLGPQLAWGSLAILGATFALAGFTLDLTQYLQVVRELSPLQAGLRVLPLVLGFALAGPIGQHLAKWMGAGRTIAAGLIIVAVLFAAGARFLEALDGYLLGGSLFVIGMAMGMVMVPATDAIMKSVSEHNAGLGSGISDSSRQLGAALGIGVLGSITRGVYEANVSEALTVQDDELSAAIHQSAAAAIQAIDATGREASPGLRDGVKFAFERGFSITLSVTTVLLMVLGWLVWRRFPSEGKAPRET